MMKMNDPDTIRLRFARRVREALNKKVSGYGSYAKLSAKIKEETGNEYPVSNLSSWFGEASGGAHLRYHQLLWWANYLGESLDWLFERDEFTPETSHQTAHIILSQSDNIYEAKRRTVIESSEKTLKIQLTLGTSWRENHSIFIDLIQRHPNIHIQVIFCTHEDIATKQMLARGRSGDGKRTLQEVESALKTTEVEFKELSNVEVRQIPMIPSYDLYIADDSSAIVIFPSFRGNVRRTPILEVFPENDSDLFTFYVEKFDALWEWDWKAEKLKDPSAYELSEQ